ncbi:MAG: hypothetical protein JSR59_18555 [Proteobacteria bacterium]|nr:hypothetical protein [Pseudomonadota bacterium]
MALNRLAAALLLAGAAVAQAAPASYIIFDHSTTALIDAPTAEGLWKDHLPPALKRLYPVGKWGFASEVSGGFDDAKVCVVTARVLLLPRAGKNLVFRPEKSATTFGSQADASPEQCRALAKSKLVEAMESLRAGLSAR